MLRWTANLKVLYHVLFINTASTYDLEKIIITFYCDINLKIVIVEVHHLFWRKHAVGSWLIQWIPNKHYIPLNVSHGKKKCRLPLKRRDNALYPALRKGHLNLHSSERLSLILHLLIMAWQGVSLSSPSVDGGCKLFALLFWYFFAPTAMLNVLRPCRLHLI